MDWGRKEFSVIKQVLGDSHKGMTVTEISRAIGMNRHSVAKYMDILVAAGHVDMRTYGHAKIFHLSHRVPIAAMLSFSSDLIVTLDRDLRVVDSNDKFLEFTGLARADVHKKNIMNFSFPLHCQPPLLPHIQAALEGNEVSADLSYSRGKAEYFFSLKAVPTIFDSGEKGATLILGDTTERVKAREALLQELDVLVRERTSELERSNRQLEAEIEKREHSEKLLRESEGRFRSWVENLNEAFWEMDTMAVFTYCSPMLAAMIGYAPEEIVGLRPFDLMTPESEEKLYKGLEQMLALDSKHTIVVVTETLHKDGHPVLMEIRSQPIYDNAGTLTGFMGIARDFTEPESAPEKRRLDEAIISFMATSFPDLIFRIDGDGVVFDHNTACSKHLFSNRGSVIGEKLTKVLPAETARILEEAVSLVKATDRPAVVNIPLRAGGRDELFEAHLQPVTGGQFVIILKPKVDTKNKQ